MRSQEFQNFIKFVTTTMQAEMSLVLSLEQAAFPECVVLALSRGVWESLWHLDCLCFLALHSTRKSWPQLAWCCGLVLVRSTFRMPRHGSLCAAIGSRKRCQLALLFGYELASVWWHQQFCSEA